MSSQERRAADRRRAWGRGPIILKLESLDRRQLLNGTSFLPDLVGTSLSSVHYADWNQSIEVQGQVKNQGGSPVATPFNVELFASPSPAIGRYAVPVGMVTIPAGVGVGQSVPFDTTIKLPATPLPGVSKSGIVYLNMKVDPTHSVPDSNYHNNQGLGMPFETSYVLITATQPPKLEGSTLAVSSTNTTWGSTVTVTAQIRNQSAGAAPPTRAMLVLTSAGQTAEWPNDVSVGNLNVPAIAPWQTVNVVQTFTLPATAPTLLAGGSSFTLSMIQDANYQTNSSYPHLPTVGVHYDQVPMTITAPANSTATAAPLADLAASSVQSSNQTLAWGQTFQVTTTVQNLGQGNAGPFTVRFLLVGQNGSINQGIFLGDAQVPGLQAGYNQQIVQTLTIPARVPAGMTLNSVGYTRVAVIVDAENTVNESLISNNLAESAPIVVRLPGTNGTSTVPTTATPGTLPSLKAQPAPKRRFRKYHHVNHVVHIPAKLHRRTPRKGSSLFNELAGLPKQVNNIIKHYV